MRFEECSVCGKEFDIRDMYETLNAYDEYTCRDCMQKMENEGQISETRTYADISEIPLGIDDYPDDEGFED